MAHFTLPDPSSLERVAYLVGFPIAHSLSPLLHHTIYSSIGKPWGQTLYETRDLNEFLAHMRKDEKFLGSSVTMPYKVAIIPHLDELTPEGEAIGAINTLFIRNDESGKRKYCGTNTDCIGIREAFLQNVADPSVYRGKPALVVGGGGTARAAVYALQNFLGCSPVYMVNRDESEVRAVIDECNARGFGKDIVHVSTVVQAEQLRAPAAVVSAVPDFTPVSEQEKVARQVLAAFLRTQEKGALLEMCYHPSPKTEIAGLAANLGWQVIMGTEAMVGFLNHPNFCPAWAQHRLCLWHIPSATKVESVAEGCISLTRYYRSGKG
jgi:quinate dehydrogenase